MVIAIPARPLGSGLCTGTTRTDLSILPDEIFRRAFSRLNNCMENSQNPEFNINDLASLKNIVELACTRGAFRANEMSAVGDIYQRLDAFLSGVVSQAQVVQQAAQEAVAAQQAQAETQGESS